MGNKVICGTCFNQTNGFCDIKKATVKLKKRRICDKYSQDTNKIKFKEEIPTTKRPNWFWDREEKRKHMRNELRGLSPEEARKSQEGINMVDAKHPLTGDLSRFKTTVGKEEEKKEKE